jgi:hypothetical protein
MLLHWLLSESFRYIVRVRSCKHTGTCNKRGFGMGFTWVADTDTDTHLVQVNSERVVLIRVCEFRFRPRKIPQKRIPWRCLITFSRMSL